VERRLRAEHTGIHAESLDVCFPLAGGVIQGSRKPLLSEHLRVEKPKREDRNSNDDAGPASDVVSHRDYQAHFQGNCQSLDDERVRGETTDGLR